MRLSDIMSQMGLASYAEAGLLLFFFAFMAVGVRVWRTSKEAAVQYAHIPLDDSPTKPSPRS
jgi:hypothetical protein